MDAILRIRGGGNVTGNKERSFEVMVVYRLVCDHVYGCAVDPMGVK